jgi:DNA-binding FrmR family transcriptional regulator
MTAIRDEGQRGAMVLRLKRIEGQLRGIQAMIAAGEDCEKIVQQLTASRRALDKAFFNVLACAVQAAPAGEARPASRAADQRVKHVAHLLAKFG